MTIKDYEDSGCIIIHTELLSDAEREEVATAIAEFMTSRFPHYVRRISGTC